MRFFLVSAVTLPLVAFAADEQDHDHHDESASLGTLGRVTFPISCKPSVQAPFERGVAMLHSFWYEASIQAFQRIVAERP